MKKVIIGLVLIVIVGLLVRPYVVKSLDQSMNVVLDHAPYAISERASALHDRLVIADWHADTTLWERSLEGPHTYGHADLRRLQQGNVGLQVFTTVTKSPAGQNYERNETSASDNITRLAIAQAWPISTWGSLLHRATYQAERVHALAKAFPSDVQLILNQGDLAEWQAARAENPRLLGALIGTEGSHALEGELANVDVLFDAGFRMMSLQHFFDNKLGGSLHGTSQAGLTEFGRAVVARMQSLDVIIDVSHSSEAVVNDVLTMSSKPLVVSHTGFKGHCDTPRNISDALMQRIAAAGGLISVGFWDGAVCDPSPESVVSAIDYGINLVGEDHIALGSDYDGTITSSFDVSEIAVLTQTMLERGFSEDVIAKVMGGNTLRFLSAHLPPE